MACAVILTGMKITELSTRELRRSLQATGKALGPDSASVLALRRKLARCPSLAEVGRLARPPPEFGVLCG